MSDISQGPGWWLASDGKWYAPQYQVPQYPQQWSYGPMPPTPRTNPFAVAALVCGVLWAGGLLSILAIIFGIVALVDLGRRDEQGRGLAIAGLVLGVIGLLGTVALMAIGVSVSRSRDPATVTISADTDTCWLATVGDADSRGGALKHDGCGNASFELDGTLERKAVVTKRTGPGPVVVVLRAGDAEDQGTVTQNLQTVTVES
jgi:hypothetical protein